MLLFLEALSLSEVSLLLKNGDAQEPLWSRLKEQCRDWKDRMLCKQSDGCSAKAVVSHPLFDTLAAMMIILSAVLMGLEVQLKVSSLAEDATVIALSNICAGYFIIELILRMAAMRMAFFTDEQARLWNLFDFALVFLSFLDFFAGADSSDAMSAFKTLKMLRVFRVFRVFRFWRHLWNFALMIARLCLLLFSVGQHFESAFYSSSRVLDRHLPVC